MPNGAIYICSIELFNKKKCLPREQIYPYEMDYQSSIDIDTISDLHIAETHIQKRGHNAYE
jgi:CMP-N-acetylneuraminic acid synthetase